jgi:hypothetical protein
MAGAGAASGFTPKCHTAIGRRRRSSPRFAIMATAMGAGRHGRGVEPQATRDAARSAHLRRRERGPAHRLGLLATSRRPGEMDAALVGNQSRRIEHRGSCERQYDWARSSTTSVCQPTKGSAWRFLAPRSTSPTVSIEALPCFRRLRAPPMSSLSQPLGIPASKIRRCRGKTRRTTGLRDVDRSPSVCRYLCGSGPGLPARPS